MSDPTIIDNLAVAEWFLRDLAAHTESDDLRGQAEAHAGDLAAAREQTKGMEATLRLWHDEHRALRDEVREWEDWSNRLAENIPDHYDGDDAQEAIIEKYVSDLRAEVQRLTDVLDRERLSQDYKPEGGEIVMGKTQDARRRAEVAEADLRALREKVTRVEALAEFWEGSTFRIDRRHAQDLRAALSDPTTPDQEGGA